MKKILMLILACMAVVNASAQWQPLFNGKNLKGWKIVGGTAEYTVKDGAITGVSTTVDNRNTFLVTEDEYGDFILEFLFKIDENFKYFNSGVQFRSHIRDNGRMYGYQYEIDPTSRAWTGGIYDEARLGWLYALTVNPEAQAAFRHGDWNKARIEAVGNRIRTWINGVPAADVLDAQDASGYIALQVHAVYDEESVGKAISWKDIRIMTENLEYEISPETGIVQKNCIPNTISEREAAEGWALLWDGRTTEGWHSHKAPEFPSKGWHIEDEAIAKEDGRIYQVIYAVPGSAPLPSEIELDIGPVLNAARPPLFAEMIGEFIAKARRSLNGMEKSATAKNSPHYLQMQEYVRKLEELL